MAAAAMAALAYASPLLPITPHPNPTIHLTPPHFPRLRPLRAAATLRDLCTGRVPDHILQRAEEVGYVVPTQVQEQSLPVLLAGRDCILHAQTGSGKTLAYLLSVFSAIDFERSAVQALVVVPTRELGIQVTKVARMLAAKECTVMALLDGGMLRRQKSWVKAEPPAIIVATVASLCQMIEKRVFGLPAMRVLVIDEVDFIFGSSKQVSSLRKILGSYSTASSRQTIFASASIPQHNRFVHDCVQHKWAKSDMVHVHVNPVEPMPSHIHHKYVSEKSKKAGQPPSTTLVSEFLRISYKGTLEVVLLEEEMNFNARATSFSEVKEKGFLLVSTDIASRGFDLPQTSHIYNYDLPKMAVEYLHRAGRTGREPFSKAACSVTTLITEAEHFVLQRFQNELMFHCEELPL